MGAEASVRYPQDEYMDLTAQDNDGYDDDDDSGMSNEQDTQPGTVKSPIPATPAVARAAPTNTARTAATVNTAHAVIGAPGNATVTTGTTARTASGNAAVTKPGNAHVGGTQAKGVLLKTSKTNRADAREKEQDKIQTNITRMKDNIDSRAAEIGALCNVLAKKQKEKARTDAMKYNQQQQQAWIKMMQQRDQQRREAKLHRQQNLTNCVSAAVVGSCFLAATTKRPYQEVMQELVSTSTALAGLNEEEEELPLPPEPMMLPVPSDSNSSAADSDSSEDGNADDGTVRQARVRVGATAVLNTNGKLKMMALRMM